MTGAAEFRRLVPLARLAGGSPFQQRIAATEVERTRLAARFDLVSLSRLEAEIELRREAGGTILMEAALEADFAQRCVVTLDPVAGAMRESFRLRFGPAAAETQVSSGEDDPAFEPLEGETIDIGEAVAQEFSLALPPFPRSAKAAVEAGAPEAPADGPFAVLRRLGRRAPQ
jgi:uncharacterized metal-binding protein YceD (DUF177 family)